MNVPSESSYSSNEEFLNAITHGVAFLMAIWGLVYLLIRAEGSLAVSSVAIYGGSLVLMFLSSTVYHSVSHQKFKPILKLIDHSAIYVLIAGTYTPFLLISLNGWMGTLGVTIIWTIAIVGLVFKWLAGQRFAKISVAFYLLMGWLIVLFIYPLYQAVPGGGLWLLLAGGVCFSVGVGFYMAKHKPFTHAIWHCFVIAGCSCQFLSIYHFVI